MLKPKDTITGSRFGQSPYSIDCSALTSQQLKNAVEIPGVQRSGPKLFIALDALPAMAREFPGVALPSPRAAIPLEQLPGYADYCALGLDKTLRPYQVEDAVRMANHAYIFNRNPMRSGKTLESIAASVLIGARRILVVAPSIAKYVWASQIARFVQSDSHILEGRAVNEFRRYCSACNKTGCDLCKNLNGQSTGVKVFMFRQMKIDEVQFPMTDRAMLKHRCPRHDDIVEFTVNADERYGCDRCYSDWQSELTGARFTIVNYDILAPQTARDEVGGLLRREDLRGWADYLAEQEWDLVIIDEIHELRARNTTSKKAGLSQRELVDKICQRAKFVWGLSGTLIFSAIKDLWGPWDLISNSRATDPRGRKFFSFDIRYCDGKRGLYAWENNGKSQLAIDELPGRLEAISVRRERSDILPYMPAKLREIVKIPQPVGGIKWTKKKASEEEYSRLLRSLAPLKVASVVDYVMRDVIEGNRVIVFTLLRESAKAVHAALVKAFNAPQYRTRIKELDAQHWLATGAQSSEQRFSMADAFANKCMAGVFVATIDAVQVALSLRGATAVHFMELHKTPAACLQAEDRPYEPGTTGLSVYYHVVEDSVDQRLVDLLTPKIEALALVGQDREAASMGAALHNTRTVDNRPVEEQIDDLLAGLSLEDLQMFSDIDFE
jgi:hypothetical protein